MPAVDPRPLFYRDDMRGLNFDARAGHHQRRRSTGCSRWPDDPDRARALHRVDAHARLPAAFRGARTPMPLLPPPVRPRIWIGNTLTVQTHFDLLDNIACVVGGRRRFTLFPPEQVPNLYIGPIDFTPSGTPISMVPLHESGPGAFSAFRRSAAPRAAGAELDAGRRDLYIPYGWWHHVESLTPFNVLVNYWWNDAPKVGSPYRLHAARHRCRCAICRPISARCGARCSSTSCSPRPKKRWPTCRRDQRGLLGPPSPERMQEVRAILARAFTRR